MADQNLNQSSPGALNQGNPPSLSPPLTPAPQTPSTAQNTAPPPTTSDGTTAPTATTMTSNSGPSSTDSGPAPTAGRVSSGAPAQPAGAGLSQGGTTIVVENSGGGGGNIATTLPHVPYANATNSLADSELAFDPATHELSVAAHTGLDMSASDGQLKTPSGITEVNGALQMNAGFAEYAGLAADVPATVWTAAALVNSWVAVAGGYVPGYTKSATGLVSLRGWLGGGASGTQAFDLPSGYRPSAIQQFPITADGAHLGLVQIGTDGSVKIYDLAGGSSVSTLSAIDSVHFYPEA